MRERAIGLAALLGMMACTGGKSSDPTDDTGPTSTSTTASTTTGTTDTGMSTLEAIEAQVAEICPAGPEPTNFDPTLWDPLGSWIRTELVFYHPDGTIADARTFTEDGDHTVIRLSDGGRLALDTYYAGGGSTYAAYDLTWLRAGERAVALCDAEYMYADYGWGTDPADPSLDNGELCLAPDDDPDTLLCTSALGGVLVYTSTYTRR